MAEDTKPQSAETQTPTGASEGASPSVDPRYLALGYAGPDEYFERTQPFIERVLPYYQDVEQFVSDESKRNVAKQAWETMESIASRQAPEVPPWAKEVLDQNKKLVGFVETLTQQQQMTNASAKIQAIAQSRWPQLAENNFSLVNDLQKEAQSLGISSVDGFVNYLERMASRMPEVKTEEERPPQRKTPPTSLRGESSLPGTATPGVPQFKNNIERRAYMKSQLRKAAGGG